MRTLTLSLLLTTALLGCRKEVPLSETDLDGDGVMADVDCDDTDPDRFQGNDELCNGLDDDCDEEVDEEAIDAPTWFADADGDGYGDPAAGETTCEQPLGYVITDTDCDDADAAFHPGAAEYDCTDPNDYNCDGSTGYADADGDGWAACEECDDSDGAVKPDADEVCNDIDDDCDGDVDQDAVDAPTWYLDSDADTYGNPAISTVDCEQPAGWVADDTDCDDLHTPSHPGGTEVCDEHDNDCDGTVDEDDATDAPTWYEDEDGDLWGADATGTTQCDAPDSTWVTRAGDCDDEHAKASPTGTEVCDDLDNDCDGSTDGADAVDASSWYADSDSDGYGDADSASVACDQPSAYVSDSTDCDDSDGDVNPGETELCNGVDDDCDGTIDEDDADDALTWYIDLDEDGYGGSRTTTACEEPSGYTDNSDDCDDLDDDAFPGNTEVCDKADNDCDGDTDESDAADATEWYADADGDGYGDADTSTTACDEPSGYTDNDDDCDDTAATSNPSAYEVCDGEDNDCDGDTDEDDAIDADTWYIDADGDGYGDARYHTDACDQPSGYTDNGDDCDDSDSGISPAATEYCDGVDNDCDGSTDEGDAVDAVVYYADDDGDDYGDPDSTQSACSQPSGYVSDDTDCHDTDDTAYPGSHETETPGDGIDTDCDGYDGCNDLGCDNYPDVLISHSYTGSSYSTTSEVYLGSSSGVATTADYSLPTYSAYDVDFGDFDGDGYVDITWSSHYDGDYNTTAYVYYGSASGYSTSDRVGLTVSSGRNTAVADLDSDGYDDWVTAFYRDNSNDRTLNSKIWWGSSSGLSSSDYTDLPTAGPQDVEIDDFDADGYLDIFFCGYNDGDYYTNSYVYWGSSGGSYSTSDRTTLAMYGCWDSEVGDFDADGYLDILTGSHHDGNYSTTSYVWYGSSSGFSTSNRFSMSTYGTLGVEVTDLDGDGYDDALVPNYYTGSSYSTTSYVYWGSSSGLSTSSRDSFTTYGPYDVGAGDLDGDGYQDLVFCTYYNGSTHSASSYVYWGSSAGLSSTATSLPTVGCTHLAIADIDQDGYDDVVFDGHHSGSWSGTARSYVYWGGSSGVSSSTRTTIGPSRGAYGVAIVPTHAGD